jgi:hypothetical protein
MKKVLLTLVIIAMSISSRSDQVSPEAEVANAVELFRQTMLKPNQKVFEALTSEKLTYGHSSGLVEDRATCIASMVSGKFKFLTLKLSDQTIDVVGNTAIVRHVFFADTHDQGKEVGTANLKVMQVWIKEAGKWKLLGRQAVKLIPVT